MSSNDYITIDCLLISLFGKRKCIFVNFDGIKSYVFFVIVPHESVAGSIVCSDTIYCTPTLTELCLSSVDVKHKVPTYLLFQVSRL